MPTFQRVKPAVNGLINGLMKKHYPELVEAELTFTALFVAPTVSEDGEPTGPALKKGGHPVYLDVKVTSSRDRAAGLADVLILIDADRDTGWPNWHEPRREAVLDEALYSLELQRDDEGQIKSDDNGRPKLKIRVPDLYLEGYIAIAERHGEASMEVEAAKQLVDAAGQLLFGFATAGV